MWRRFQGPRRHPASDAGNVLGPLVHHAVGFALTVPPALLLVVLIPGPLLLPVLSLAAMAIAGGAAVFGWARRERWDRDRITSWDIAGAFALIGCAAGMLSQPENALQLFGVPTIP
jgi:hypothetical protein